MAIISIKMEEIFGPVFLRISGMSRRKMRIRRLVEEVVTDSPSELSLSTESAIEEASVISLGSEWFRIRGERKCGSDDENGDQGIAEMEERGEKKVRMVGLKIIY